MVGIANRVCLSEVFDSAFQFHLASLFRITIQMENTSVGLPATLQATQVWGKRGAGDFMLLFYPPMVEQGSQNVESPPAWGCARVKTHTV